ncbi:hypothetical protein LZ30DRAFT_699628 [Colletotrichum cereale]|nr:hypothetical protein LZ30DRAFT_699628 [Colletotrichum cereale]
MLRRTQKLAKPPQSHLLGLQFHKVSTWETSTSKHVPHTRTGKVDDERKSRDGKERGQSGEPDPDVIQSTSSDQTTPVPKPTSCQEKKTTYRTLVLQDIRDPLSPLWFLILHLPTHPPHSSLCLALCCLAYAVVAFTAAACSSSAFRVFALWCLSSLSSILH